VNDGVTHPEFFQFNNFLGKKKALPHKMKNNADIL